MLMLWRIAALLLITDWNAHAEAWNDFFQQGSAWSQRMEASKEKSSTSSCPYSPGYPGPCVFDKKNHLIVYEGGYPITHEDAVEFSKRYNATH